MAMTVSPSIPCKSFAFGLQVYKGRLLARAVATERGQGVVNELLDTRMAGERTAWKGLGSLPPKPLHKGRCPHDRDAVVVPEGEQPAIASDDRIDARLDGGFQYSVIRLVGHDGKRG